MNLGASATAGGLCHAAERPVRWAGEIEPMVKGYLAFMDHSITEQLTGDSAAWHTTAIALSEGGEVSDLARSISRSIFPDEPRLRKWSAGRPPGKRRYRTAFARELACQLPGSPVFLLATSATEATIAQARDQVLRELRVAHLCEEVRQSGGSRRLRVGPFINSETGAEHFFEHPLNRALMILWAAHFVARMHRMFRSRLQASHGSLLVLDWFFYVDKFVGDSPGSSPATAFFQTLVSGNITNGNVRSSFFVEGDTVDADLFADNVAGLLNDFQRTPTEYPELPSLLESGRIYYEAGSPAA